MPELEPVQKSDPAETSPSLWRQMFHAKDIGFYLMIILSWIGIIYATFDLVDSRWYWHWLIPGFGVICILMKWSKTEPTPKGRLCLVLREILYWGGVLAMTYVLYALSLSKDNWVNLFDDRQVSFLISFILAMSTYLASFEHGWQLSVVAIFIFVAGLINVVFSNFAPMLVWVGVGIIALYVVWTWLRSRWERRKSTPPAP